MPAKDIIDSRGAKLTVKVGSDIADLLIAKLA